MSGEITLPPGTYFLGVNFQKSAAASDTFALAITAVCCNTPAQTAATENNPNVIQQNLGFHAAVMDDGHCSFLTLAGP